MCKQEPPPPQADGKKMLLFPKVVKSVLPPPTSISASTVNLIFTAPKFTNLDFAYN